MTDDVPGETATVRGDEHLRRVLENIPTAIAMASPGGDVLFCNTLFEQTFGYCHSDIPTVARWAELAYPEPAYRQEALAWWAEAVAKAIDTNGVISAREFVIRCKDGRPRETLISASIYSGHLVTSLVDLSEMRAREAALVDAKRALEKTAYDLTENIPAGAYTMVLPPDRGLAYFSFMTERFLELTGLNREKALENPLNAFACVHPDDYEAWVKQNAEVFEKKAPFHGTCRVVVGDKTRWITAESKPRSLPDGSTVWEGILSDVTERELARQQAELGNRIKSEFVANVSHEIRTPLNAISGFTQLLVRKMRDPEQIALTEQVQSACRALTGIIDDLLDFSKIETGNFSIERTQFNIAELMEELEGEWAPMAEAKGIRFSIDLQSAGSLSWATDRGRLKQILVNLISNAVKFTETGGVRVSVKVSPSGDSGLGVAQAMIRAEIEDTGIGIKEEDQEKIFNPFTQVDASLRRRYGGAGLGLSITRRLVTLMGGELGVDSALSQGSSFWFELPLSRVSLATASASEIPAHQDVHGSKRLTGIRLLVADDSTTNLRLMEAALVDEGADVFLAASGEQALAAIQKGELFDAMLLDVQMPGIDGHDLTRRIRVLPGFASMPVIAVTAGGRSDQRSAALAAGMNAVIVKPVDLEALVATIRQCLNLDDSAKVPPPRSGNDPSGPAVREKTGAYWRLFTVFQDEYSTFGSAAREALAQGELERICGLMHKIRGAARQMGAEELLTIASELEVAAAANDPQCSELVDQFEASLVKFINTRPTAK